MPKATILCVDDDLKHLIECQVLLRNHGYHALITTNERKGLLLLATLPIEAVILHGPAANGELLAANLKKIKPQIPVLLLASGARLPERSRSADTVLSDRASTDKLLEALRGLLSSRSPFFDAWFSDWKRRSAA